jgi:hypothetical protein
MAATIQCLPILTFFFSFQVGEWRRGLLFAIPVVWDLLVIVLLAIFSVVQACGGLDFLAPIVLAR